LYEELLMRSLELFSGAGGLAMGMSFAGFKPCALVEWDKWSCDTIRENSRRGFPLVVDWPVWEGDARNFDFGSVNGTIDIVVGGPPCQPFSMGGKHRAMNDRRDMFPTMVEAVRKLEPKAFIVENVKGLTRSNFANYYNYIQLQFEFPELIQRPDEAWDDHFRRLQQEKSRDSALSHQLRYRVLPTLVNAADYGVPQRRERVFLVGFRSDLNADWAFPKGTHSGVALHYDQWTSNSYWERHRVATKDRPQQGRGARPLQQRAAMVNTPTTKPWVTVRDALVGLPHPRSLGAGEFRNHAYQGGARSYAGHTGSPVDLPAKTLKAGDHGVPGGENMMLWPNGDVRYFTVREAARLQTFPDGYVFHGSWSETMRQLGNAVPVTLAATVASSVAVELVKIALRNVKPAKGIRAG